MEKAEANSSGEKGCICVVLLGSKHGSPGFSEAGFLKSELNTSNLNEVPDQLLDTLQTNCQHFNEINLSFPVVWHSNCHGKKYPYNPLSTSLMFWKILFPTWLDSLKSHHNTPTCSVQRKYILKRKITFPALVLKARLTLCQLFRLSMFNPLTGAIHLPFFCLLCWDWYSSTLARWLNTAHPAPQLSLRDTSTGLAALPWEGETAN